MKRERLPFTYKRHANNTVQCGVQCPKSGTFSDVQACIRCEYFYMRIDGHVLCEYKARQNEKEYVIPVHVL